jgi:hypothetical protein
MQDFPEVVFYALLDQAKAAARGERLMTSATLAQHDLFEQFIRAKALSARTAFGRFQAWAAKDAPGDTTAYETFERRMIEERPDLALRLTNGELFFWGLGLKK